MSPKFALVIGNTEYKDSSLSQLTAPGRDAEDFAGTLQNPYICAFDDVKVLLNEPEYVIREAIDELFSEKKPDDLLLLYFSGHGIRDEFGTLYLAVKNTNRSRLRATSIQSSFITEAMDQSRSLRQVLILDCCNSGAFPRGTKAQIGGSVGTRAAFEGKGYGRVVLTASDATQFAWEGDQVRGETKNSLFTHFLINGLSGEADSDGDGRITVDELYDYAYGQIVSIWPEQTPGKWAYRQQGRIILREITRIEDLKPLPLSPDLLEKLEDKSIAVRKAAVRRLVKLLGGKNLRLARSAREELERIANMEDSPAISEIAHKALQPANLGDSNPVQEQVVRSKPEREKAVKANVEHKEKEEPESAHARKEEVTHLELREPEDKRLSKTEPELQSEESVIPAGVLATLFSTFAGLKPVARRILLATVSTIVFVIVGMVFRAFSTPETTTVMQTPPIVATNTPSAQIETIVPNTPTPDVLVSVAGPAMEIGSRYTYIDGTDLVAIPAGQFNMGGDGIDNPEHQVTLADYWIYSTEVTNQQYELCVTLGNCTVPDLDDNPGYSNYRLANDPVTGVTYEQAANYCEFVNGRLPTEAEWEKAAQSPQAETYPWGDAAPTCDLVNFDNCLEGLASVVNYSEGISRYGALNMSGNALEWVADWYHADYYKLSPAENPPGPTNGTLKAVRSSSYASDADQVTVAIRNAEDPQTHRPDLGFRCVVEEPTYFAPFCESPFVYDAAAIQETDSLESCPDLGITPVPFCNNGIPQTNITFVGPTEATIDSQNCIASANPNLFTCTTKGTTVSISAACELNDFGAPSCPPGYSERGNVCVVDRESNQTAGNCLAGTYNSSQQCCNVPLEQTDPSPFLAACPVGTFYAAKANACLPQPVQEIVTASLEVTLQSCPSPSGGGGGGSGDIVVTPVTGGGGGCQATQAQIDDCNALAPFWTWNSAACSCEEHTD